MNTNDGGATAPPATGGRGRRGLLVPGSLSPSASTASQLASERESDRQRSPRRVEAEARSSGINDLEALLADEREFAEDTDRRRQITVADEYALALAAAPASPLVPPGLGLNDGEPHFAPATHAALPGDVFHVMIVCQMVVLQAVLT